MNSVTYLLKLEGSLRRILAILAACVVIGAGAFVVRMIFLPDIVPIGFADEPQSVWAVEIAFLLRATELIALFSGALAAIAALSRAIKIFQIHHA